MRAYSPRRGYTRLRAAATLGGLIVLCAWLLPILGDWYPPNRRALCQSHLGSVALAVRMYLADNDEKFPPYVESTDGWAQFVRPYVKRDDYFRCPSAAFSTHKRQNDFFFNRRLVGAKDLKEPFFSQTIMLGDGAGAGAGGQASYLSAVASERTQSSETAARRHSGGANYAFVDGRVKWLRPEEVSGALQGASSAREG